MCSRKAEGNKITDATCVQSAMVAYYTERTATCRGSSGMDWLSLPVYSVHDNFSKLPHGKDLLMRQLDCSQSDNSDASYLHAVVCAAIHHWWSLTSQAISSLLLCTQCSASLHQCSKWDLLLSCLTQLLKGVVGISKEERCQLLPFFWPNSTWCLGKVLSSVMLSSLMVLPIMLSSIIILSWILLSTIITLSSIMLSAIMLSTLVNS